MDISFDGFLNSSSEIRLGNRLSDWETDSRPRFETSYPVEDRISPFQEHSILGIHLLPDTPFTNENVLSTPSGDDYQDDCDFSDAPLLRYINQMLMEEDMEEQTHMLQESLDFQAKEKSFYDVIGKKYPPSPLPEWARFGRNSESPDNNNPFLKPYSSSSSSSDGSGYLMDIINQSWINSRNNSVVQSDSPDSVSISVGASNACLDNIVDGLSDFSRLSPLVRSESQSAWNFKKGVEEASRFIPSGNNLSVNADIDGSDFRSKRNHYNVETDLEEENRSSKLPALDVDVDTIVEEFDVMLLNSMGEGREKFGAYRAELKDAVNKAKRQLKQPSGKKGRVKKQNKKKEVIDLRTLLINCAQAVAADDSRNANELLKRIRQHSSPRGDGNQRLAHYLSDALEARLAGSGSQIYKSIVTRKTSAADYLKAYYTSLASAPFNKVSNLATIRTIINRTRKAMRVHVIDFGILYGFKWPTFIQRIAKREGGPPKVKITGIDFPQPGFKPAERVKDTGRRLAHYAEKFNVPFEYNAIAQKWETIKIKDLKIEKGEFVAVACLYRAKNLTDETVVAHSSRTSVLNLIRKINPDIFVSGVVNGTYSAPFFLTRFREVLYHYSAMFDMLEACVPRETPERTLIERDIFAREAFNVVACEGWERVERPETYKQWQVRNMKAGFAQVPFDREIIQEAMEKVNAFFHKDFLIDEQGKWILLGWRGRIINAISCWKPV